MSPSWSDQRWTASCTAPGATPLQQVQRGYEPTPDALVAGSIPLGGRSRAAHALPGCRVPGVLQDRLPRPAGPARGDGRLRNVERHAVERASATVISETARAEGMRTLRDDGMLKVASGVTTIDEILRVVV